MKRLFLIGIITTGLFANSLEDRVKILEQKVAKLEQVVYDLNKTQKVIQKDTKKTLKIAKAVNKCNGLKIVDFDYKSTTIGLDKGYILTFKIKNNYKSAIKNVDVMIGMIDNEDTTLVQEHLIKENVNIEPNKTKIVTDKYLINDDLSKYLAQTPKKDIRLNVQPLSIILKNGQIIKCNRW